jgi:hypothetical protein
MILQTYFFSRIVILMALLTPIFPVYSSNIYIHSGARSAAISHSSVTLADCWSSFNNQAGLAFLSKTEAGIDFENRYLLKEFQTYSGTVAVPLKPGTLAASFCHFGYQLYSESKAALALSRKFANRVAVSVQFDFLQKHIAEGYGQYNAVATEIGLMGIVSQNLTLGFHIFNPVPIGKKTLPEEQIPTVGRLGLKYTVGKISLMGETEKDTRQSVVFKGGIEVEAIKDFFIRGGYASGWEQFSFGMGYRWHKFVCDVAFAHHQVLGLTPNIALGYVF